MYFCMLGNELVFQIALIVFVISTSKIKNEIIPIAKSSLLDDEDENGRRRI